jgi:hypothetical protein
VSSVVIQVGPTCKSQECELTEKLHFHIKTKKLQGLNCKNSHQLRLQEREEVEKSRRTRSSFLHSNLIILSSSLPPHLPHPSTHICIKCLNPAFHLVDSCESIRKKKRKAGTIELDLGSFFPPLKVNRYEEKNLLC